MTKGISILIGKTIKDAKWIAKTGYDGEPVDDGPYLQIEFTDNTHLSLSGGYQEDWTGNSKDEYPTYLFASLFNNKGVIYTTLDEQDRTVFPDESNIEQPIDGLPASSLAKDKDGQS